MYTCWLNKAIYLLSLIFRSWHKNLGVTSQCCSRDFKVVHICLTIHQPNVFIVESLISQSAAVVAAPIWKLCPAYLTGGTPTIRRADPISLITIVFSLVFHLRKQRASLFFNPTLHIVAESINRKEEPRCVSSEYICSNLKGSFLRWLQP